MREEYKLMMQKLLENQFKAREEFANRVGAVIRETAATRKGFGWFGPHMEAATHAILERIPLADLTLEVRDCRIPVSSACQCLDSCSLPSSRRLVVLNKADLADPSQTKKWMKYFEEQNFPCYRVNSHNKDNIREFINFLRARIRALKVGHSNYTATVMLVGIPNVGKSAIAKSLHHIGRISAAEKGKLKHAIVSPSPGETKDINSYKIASHPNIYVMDTPGILPPKIFDDQTASKLVLTGAINDSLVGQVELAEYLLAILNSDEKYKQWEKLIKEEEDKLMVEKVQTEKQRKRQFATDHTQDFIVRDVRRILFNSISSFKGNVEHENHMVELIGTQFMALHEAFRTPKESGGNKRIAKKLLDLYRTGRIGHYTLDPAPLC